MNKIHNLIGGCSVLIGLLPFGPSFAQESVVARARQVSALTGRPVLAVAGRNT